MANEKRLIDAYKLEDLLQSNSARYHHKDDVIAAIAGQPTVDAVEVVRCKDCQYGCKLWFDDKGVSFCRKIGIDIKPNHFCSYGERRSDEG